MDRATTMRITSPAGTDLTLYKEGRPALGIYSISDIPGRWDIWPSGMVNCAPIEDKGDGVLVLEIGDMMLVLQQYVRERVYMEIENGAIKKITGGLEAELLASGSPASETRTPTTYRTSAGAASGGPTGSSPVRTTSATTRTCRSRSAPTSESSPAPEPSAQPTTTSPVATTRYWCDDTQIMADGEFLIDELKFKDEGDATGEGQFPRGAL